jgi:ferredoxin-NADP reductase
MEGDVVLVYRALQEQDLVFGAELDRLAHERSLALHYVVGDHRTPEGARLLTPAHLRALLSDLAEREVYICGPPAMVRVLEANVRAAGVPPASIHTERFAL